MSINRLSGRKKIRTAKMILNVINGIKILTEHRHVNCITIQISTTATNSRLDAAITCAKHKGNSFHLRLPIYSKVDPFHLETR